MHWHGLGDTVPVAGGERGKNTIPVGRRISVN